MEEFPTLSDVKKKYNNQSLKTKFVAQRDLNRHFLVFRNLDHFIAEYPRLYNLHEVVFTNRPRKFVVDIDCKMITKDDSIIASLQKEVERIKKIIRAMFNQIYNEAIGQIITIDSCGQSNDQYKFSINLVVDGFYFANQTEFSKFGTKLISVYDKHKKFETNSGFIDPAFYNRADAYSQFCIRMPGHSKFGENRPKKVLDDVDPIRALVTNIQNCQPLPILHKNETINNKKKYKMVKNLESDIDVAEILRVSEHIWIRNFNVRDVQGNRINFNRIQPSHCDLCNEIHHKDNHLFISYFNNAVWWSCRHHEGGKKFKFIAKLGDTIINEPSPVEDSTELDPKQMFPDNKDIYLIKAHMKMGKTEQCIKYLKAKEIKSAIIISFRRVFAADMKKRYEDFELYSDINGPIAFSQHPKLICQVESLSRIQYPIPEIEVVIIDEIESVWSQFSHSQMSDYHGVISTFKNLLLRAKKIIGMDADLSQRTFRLLRMIIPKFDETYNLYKHPHNPMKTIRYNFVESRLSTVALALKNLYEGKNVVIVTNSIKVSDELYDFITTKIGDIKIGIYNSRTAESKKAKHFADVNHHWAKYQCMIYTPTVTSGVNFTVPHFDIMIGIFTAGSCNVETCKQMMGRIRELRENNIYIHVTETLDEDTLYETDPEQIRNNMKYERDRLLEYARGKYNLEYLPFEYSIEGHAQYYDHLAYYIISENIAFDNKSRNGFQSLLIRYLKKADFAVREISDTSLGINILDIKYEYNKSRDALHKRQSLYIHESDDLTPDQFREIKNKVKSNIDITSDEQNACAKFRLKKQLGCELNMEIIKIYKSSNSSASRQTKQFRNCKGLYDVRNRVTANFRHWQGNMEATNYLRDAITCNDGVQHQMIFDLFELINFSKSLPKLMIERKALEYAYPFISRSSSEYSVALADYWRERLPVFKRYLEELFGFHRLSIKNNFCNLGPDDMLEEFIRLLKNVYGLTQNNGSHQGSANIIFKFQDQYYLCGIRTDKRDLPIIEI